MVFRALKGLAQRGGNDPLAEELRSCSGKKPESAASAEGLAAPDVVAEARPGSTVALNADEADAGASRSHPDGLAPRSAEAEGPGHGQDSAQPTGVVGAPEPNAEADAGPITLADDATDSGSHPDGLAPHQSEVDDLAEETGQTARDASPPSTPKDALHKPVQKVPSAEALGEEIQTAAVQSAGDPQQTAQPPAEALCPDAEVLTDDASTHIAGDKTREEIALNGASTDETAVEETAAPKADAEAPEAERAAVLGSDPDGLRPQAARTEDLAEGAGEAVQEVPSPELSCPDIEVLAGDASADVVGDETGEEIALNGASTGETAVEEAAAPNANVEALEADGAAVLGSDPGGLGPEAAGTEDLAEGAGEAVQETSSPELSCPDIEVLAGDASADVVGDETGEATTPEGKSGDEAVAEDITADPAPRSPGRYRPKLKERARAAPVPPAANRATSEGRAPASAALEADLVLTFRPGGWGMDLSLLLRRPEGMPEQIVITLGGQPAELSAIDDRLFEPAQLADPAIALHSGVAVESAGPGSRRWVRTGRRLHVFTERAGVFGFTSVPRVVIGQENVILCEGDLAARVLELCGSTGSVAPPEAAGPGLPEGWRCFRGYWPRRPGSWDDDDIYLALSPLPDAAIEFAGGVATSRSTWITGRPPSIRILGALPAPGDVTIDNKPASCSADGEWTGPGWDELGAHTVRYAGLLRRYEIVQAEEDWGWWPAHTGPGLVLAGALASLDSGKHAAVVLEGQGAWLLGARPGEIARTIAWPGAAGAFASPAFKPVWAIPPKTRRRPAPHLLDFAEAPQPLTDGVSVESVRLWRQVIRDASDVPHGGDASAVELWRAYKAAGRSLRRRSR